MCVGVDFVFEFILFRLYSASWICRFTFLVNLKRFSVIFFFKCFLAPHSSSFLPGLWWHECHIFHYRPTVCLCFLFCQCVFSLLFRLGNFYLSVSHFTYSFLSLFLFAVELMLWTFNFGYFFSVLKFPLDFSLCLLFVCLNFLFFILASLCLS